MVSQTSPSAPNGSLLGTIFLVSLVVVTPLELIAYKENKKKCNCAELVLRPRLSYFRNIISAITLRSYSLFSGDGALPTYLPHHEVQATHNCAWIQQHVVIVILRSGLHILELGAYNLDHP